jgi:uncharacterized protein YcfL
MIRLLTALLLFLTACAAPSGGFSSSSAGAPQSGERLGGEISSLIRGLSMSEGRRVVSLDLRNEAERTIRFSWAVEWMDGAGVTCPGTPSQWQEVRLKPGASASAEIKAPTPRAASWRIIAIEEAP